ncbi:hypothetical protein BN59_02322 [Legionella massiliensis]|uniref:PH domain-containing protein n=1 Tax=Legionella massiliensis TaxID=1034943 RepID=A0A078KUA0_9GAMM|nr:hypothetical protein [Legionella massiliensis]CDZ78025.1 hypothetical protein BN59_02322 [Legionella massiliensis]CEE13763.1 hypothetical protein BN1094_02322 [Legionella massiliensis]
MVWNDSVMTNTYCPPKIYYIVITFMVCIITFLAAQKVIMYSNVEDKLVVLVGVFLTIYFSVSNLFIIIKGDGFVKSIKQEGERFHLTNYFNKQVTFSPFEIESIKLVENSTMNKVFAFFIRKARGLDLILKNGHKYRITSDMEDFEGLKEHLLGMKVEDINR